MTDETMLIPESVIKKPHIDNIMQTGIKQFREAKSSEWLKHINKEKEVCFWWQ